MKQEKNITYVDMCKSLNTVKTLVARKDGSRVDGAEGGISSVFDFSHGTSIGVRCISSGNIVRIPR